MSRDFFINSAATLLENAPFWRKIKDSIEGKPRYSKIQANFMLKTFVEDLLNNLEDPIISDSFILILGEPGTLKSSFSTWLYYHLFKGIYGRKPTTNEILRDLITYPFEYLDRIHLKIKKEALSRSFLEMRISPEVVILDEAHNLFDKFFSDEKLTRQMIKKTFEVREFRLIHIANTQSANQIASRITKNRVTHLFINVKFRVYAPELVEEYQRLTNKNTHSFFAVLTLYYTKDTAAKVLHLLAKKHGVTSLRYLLTRTPYEHVDSLLPILFDQESKEVYGIYRKYKLVTSLISSIKDRFNIKSVVLKYVLIIIKQILNENISLELDESGKYYDLKSAGLAIPINKNWSKYFKEQTVFKYDEIKNTGIILTGIHKEVVETFMTDIESVRLVLNSKSFEELI